MISGNVESGSFGDHLGAMAMWRALAASVLMPVLLIHPAVAQNAAGQAVRAETTAQKVERLTTAVAQAQAQMSACQKQLQQLQLELSGLLQQMNAEKGGATTSPSPAAPPNTAANDDAGAISTGSSSSTSLEDLRERQALQQSQIETHEMSKVETDSKYPLKVSGLLLFNGFVNTRQVDVPADPAYALPGAGSTGFSLRQTVLGLDARGPHLLGAASHADVRVDFFGNAALQSGYDAGGLLRLRSAHGALGWKNTEAFVELDRPLVSPNVPSSLVAVAQPEFAWSGNLWTWNPQIGITQQIQLNDSTRLKLQTALIDVANPPLLGTASTTPARVSLSERSRWPGAEARIALATGASGTGAEIGLGGYFNPLETDDNVRVDAWAGTIDLRLPVTRHFEMTANAYRGQALGGLGAGGYIDTVYQYVGSTETARALDDVGGWAQLKGKVNERLEFNGGYGIDNPFAYQIRETISIAPSASSTSPAVYSGLARNRSVFGNVIYSPSAYLLFSLEYRQLWTNYITGATISSNAIGVAAGYKF